MREYPYRVCPDTVRSLHRDALAHAASLGADSARARRDRDGGFYRRLAGAARTLACLCDALGENTEGTEAMLREAGGHLVFLWDAGNTLNVREYLDALVLVVAGGDDSLAKRLVSEQGVSVWQYAPPASRRAALIAELLCALVSERTEAVGRRVGEAWRDTRRDARTDDGDTTQGDWTWTLAAIAEAALRRHQRMFDEAVEARARYWERHARERGEDGLPACLLDTAGYAFVRAAERRGMLCWYASLFWPGNGVPAQIIQ